ncbi:MAG TPA: L,D-transpeptidase family protein [Bacteroidia bacterium]|nr:L,D-transpeptidase family protein [Bacteroidia bacterium]
MRYKIFFLFLLLNILLGAFILSPKNNVQEEVNLQCALLQKYLDKYQEIKNQGGWPVIKAGKIISLGMTDTRMQKIKQRFIISGELIKTTTTITDTFDVALENAVKQFQKNNSLQITGIIDNKTIKELNISVAARIHQLEINLERWKNMPSKFEKKYFFINIAANEFELIENDSLIMSMKIIVGRSDRKTPVFNADVTYIIFNPYWIIPPGIMKKDILQKVKADTSYISKNNMIVYKDNKEIAYTNLNWDEVDSNHVHYKIIQTPGPNNPLGVIEFTFPNPYFVYMHDTPSKKLFDEPSPAFSSGCIRVSKAVELAKYILLEDKNWKGDKIDSLINTGKNYKVYLNNPIKIYITYFTAWVNKDGSLQFAPDIYKKDN